MTLVLSPDPRLVGERHGVWFDAGAAQVTDERLLGVFRREGYEVGGEIRAQIGTPLRDASTGPEPSPQVHVGTKLRDAAVDPRPGDFAVPTNAGVVHPHGPESVAPGVSPRRSDDGAVPVVEGLDGDGTTSEVAP